MVTEVFQHHCTMIKVFLGTEGFNVHSSCAAMLHFVEIVMLLLYTGYYFRFSCHYKCYACYASLDEVAACRIYLLSPSLDFLVTTGYCPETN